MPLLFIRRAAERGLTRRPGVGIRHAFSGGDYHDPAWTGFGVLRALNEVDIAPGTRLAPQRRANMEIVTLVVAGTFDPGDGAVAGAGEVLRLRAGHGIEVVEGNASADMPLRLLQLWLQPDRVNMAPDLARMATGQPDGWRDLAGGAGLPLRAGAVIRHARLRPHTVLAAPEPGSGRSWLQVVEGDIALDAARAAAGDALAWADARPTLQAGAGGAMMVLVTQP